MAHPRDRSLVSEACIILLSLFDGSPPFFSVICPERQLYEAYLKIP